MKNVKDTVKKIYGNYPEKVLQFGEGNFLRAFVDWMIEGANERGDYEGSIVLCQPIADGGFMKDMINQQDGIYTVAMRGIEDGKPVERYKKITSVSRCINAYDDYDALTELIKSKDLEVVVSNTTEAGIAYRAEDQLTDRPAASFPGKVTQLLYERYKAFDGDRERGLLFVPVELIDNNGAELKRIVLKYAAQWELPEDFIAWIEEANKFASTLVDRIVTGYPRDEIEYFQEKLGYEDNIIVTCEVFNLWVIEGKKEWANIIPLHKGEANVIWTEDVKPYKTRKVRILNGGHTSTVLAAYLAGHNTVLDFMKDEVFQNYLQQLLYKEVIPTLDLEKEELETFAKAVSARFANPYIKHNLLDISLNSCSKFNARCIPSLLGYVEKKQELPELLTFSLAAFIKFYEGVTVDGQYMGTRADGTQYAIRDEAQVTAFFETVWKSGSTADIARQVLGHTEFWSGGDLTEIAGLVDKVAVYLQRMGQSTIQELVAELAAVQ